MDAPVIEPATPPADPTQAPVQPPVSGALLSGIRVLRPNDPPKEPEAPKAPDAVVEPEKPKESEPIKPEPVKAEIPEDPTKGLSEPAAKKFKSLEKHKIQAEQERDEARKQLESVRQEHEALKKEAAHLQALKLDAIKAIEEARTYREELRKVNLERDPEFQQQYNGQILSRQQQMLDMAVSSGADQNEFVKAINSGDEDALEAIRETLPASKQRIWDSNRTEIERIAYDRKQALKDADKTIREMEEKRSREAASAGERYKAENISMARNTIDLLWKEIPDLDKAGLEVKAELQDWLSHAVVNASKDELTKHLAIGQIAQRVVDAQKGEIDRLAGELASRDKEMEEMKEKLGEQETFIKDMSSRTPRITPGGQSSPATENGSLLSHVRVRLPGR